MNETKLFKKLFSSFPFIYKVNEQYYAFGQGVCSSTNYTNQSGKTVTSLFAQSKYEDFQVALQNPHEKDGDAYEVFFENFDCATNIGLEIGYHNIHIEEFEKYHFNENDMKNIESQLNMMQDFYQKHHLDETNLPIYLQKCVVRDNERV